MSLPYIRDLHPLDIHPKFVILDIVCIFKLFQELPVGCGHAHAGHTQKLNFKGGDELFESLVQLINTSKPIKLVY